MRSVLTRMSPMLHPAVGCSVVITVMFMLTASCSSDTIQYEHVAQQAWADTLSFSDADINTPGVSGSSSYSNGTYTKKGEQPDTPGVLMSASENDSVSA